MSPFCGAVLIVVWLIVAGGGGVGDGVEVEVGIDSSPEE